MRDRFRDLMRFFVSCIIRIERHPQFQRTLDKKVRKDGDRDKRIRDEKERKKTYREIREEIIIDQHENRQDWVNSRLRTHFKKSA